MESPDPFPSIQSLLAETLPTNRFLSTRLAHIAPPKDLADFSARFPFTLKQDLVDDQLAHPPFGSNLTFPRSAYTRFSQTSGTTGRPLPILDTAESWQGMLENWKTIYRAAQVASGSIVYFAFSFGPFLGFWTAFEAAAQLGCLCLPGGGLSSIARIKMIIDQGAEVICATPTYALRLVQVAAEEKIDLTKSKVRTIIVAGEPGGSIPELRSRISAGWNGAQIVDHYGMTEVGPVAYQDPHQSGVLRLIEQSYFAEFIHPNGIDPVAAGQIGELVITPLRRHAWPLLRFRTGDLVRWSRDSQGIALTGGIIGRTDDMIVVRGVNLYPSALEAVIRSIPEIGEYHLIVSTLQAMTEITAQIESDDDTAAQRLQHAFDQTLGLRIPVEHLRHGSLPRFEMKAKRWTKLTPAHA